MKQAQNARKQRTRNVSRKGGGKNNNSNGNPGNHRSDNKVRGNPKQLLEKYKTQARDALQAGDRVTAEYYYQFADHYQRVLNDMQANQQSSQGDDDPRQRRGRGRGRRGDDNDEVQTVDNKQADSNEEANSDKQDQTSDQPAVVDPASTEQPVEVHPELDLGAEEAPVKPKRKAPVRRKRVAKKADDAPVEDAAPQDGEAA